MEENKSEVTETTTKTVSTKKTSTTKASTAKKTTSKKASAPKETKTTTKKATASAKADAPKEATSTAKKKTASAKAKKDASSNVDSEKKTTAKKVDAATKTTTPKKETAKKVAKAEETPKQEVVQEVKEEKPVKKGRPKKQKAEQVSAEAEEKVTEKKKQGKKPEVDTLVVEGYRKLKLHTYILDQIKSPKAIVLIVHGMQEHAGRYIDFAKYLNSRGYIVFANDLRGHGLSAVDGKFGYGEADIFKETVQDEIVILEKIKDAYSLPVYLFGHSYGSMVSQSIIQNTDIVEKCVLCGTANGSSGIMKLGARTSSFLSIFKKENSGGGMIENMCIKSYGKKFEDGNWLTKDREIFEKYKADPMCGGSFPFSFYKSMLTNMKKVNEGINKIGNKKLFLIAGDKDPVGSKGKQVKKLCKLYLSHNVDARYKLYPNCRHELINETCRDEVYADIADFFDE